MFLEQHLNIVHNISFQRKMLLIFLYYSILTVSFQVLNLNVAALIFADSLLSLALPSFLLLLLHIDLCYPCCHCHCLRFLPLWLCFFLFIKLLWIKCYTYMNNFLFKDMWKCWNFLILIWNTYLDMLTCMYVCFLILKMVYLMCTFMLSQDITYM